MEEPTQPTTTNAQSTASEHLTSHDIARIVREELDRNNRIVDLIQSYADKDRSNFEFLFKRTVYIGGALLVIAAGIGLNSLHNVNQDLRAGAKAMNEQAQAEISAIKATAVAVAAESKAIAATAALDAKLELRKQVEKEFDQANIRQIVQTAANDRAKGELESAIRSEAGEQVSKALERERPELKRVIAANTELVVKDLRGSISKAVEEETSNQIGKSLMPIQTQIDASVSALKVQAAISETLAPVRDRPAFIYLSRVAVGLEPESNFPAARNAAQQRIDLARIAYDRLANEERNFYSSLGPGPFPIYDIPSEVLQKLEAGTDPQLYSSALRAIPSLSGFIPTFVHIIENDPTFANVVAAMQRLNVATQNNFDYWRPDDVSAWWKKNKSRYPKCGKNIC